jgi:transposase-like protein
MPNVSSIKTAGEVVTYWMYRNSSISVSIILNGLQTRKNYINGIESFWSQAKRHVRKFNGVPKEHFGLFLKEREWRFNNPKTQAQLSMIKQWVKQYLT